jgi:hypothetical protein
MVHALFTDRSDKEALEPADPPCPNDQKIRLGTGAHQCRTWNIHETLAPHRKRGLARDD